MRTVALMVGAATLAVLAGCGGPTTGEPVAEDGPDQRTPTEDPPTAESGATGDYSLARLCGLLQPEEARRLGASPEGREGNSMNDGHALCTWSDETSLVAGVTPGATTANVRGGPGTTLTPTTVEGMPALRSEKTDPVDACEILVDLPSGNLFSVSAAPLSAGEGRYDPCAVADEFAAITVPRVKDE